MNSYSFHESSLFKIFQQDQTLSLFFEDVTREHINASAVVELSGLRSVLKDGVSIESFLMECEDAEILSLDLTATSLAFTVEWNSWQPRLAETHSYLFRCDALKISFNGPDGLAA